jgi:MFS family permease
MPDTKLYDSRMNATELRASFSLAGIFSLRMLGLFMILPVFSIYGEQYEGFSPMTVGLAIGIYGLTQALFQIPFGLLSDRLGRKRMIIIGLIIFAFGSMVSALSLTMTGVIIGRALQGLGAISAVVLALNADLTREEQRTKAMAIIGVSIGMAFALAMVLGPAIASAAGMPGLFWATGLLALGGIAVLIFYVPNPVVTQFHRDTEPVLTQFSRILKDPQLLRLDFGIMVLHLIMTATFVALPGVLRELGNFEASEHTRVYLIALPISVLLMAPCIMYADRHNRVKHVYLAAIGLLALAQFSMAFFNQTLWHLVVALVAYFTAFNILEATLPSLISRLAPPELKGTALGAYATSQNLGAFLGGLGGGWLMQEFGSNGVFTSCAGVAIAWALIAAGMRNPKTVSTQLLKVGVLQEHEARALGETLLGIPGVDEAVVVAEDGIAYLKVDKKILDRDALMAYAESFEEPPPEATKA